MPAHVVVAVQSHFVAGRNQLRRQVRGGEADLGARQQGAVAHGLEAVKGRSPGAPHLFQKTSLPEDPENGPAGVVRTQGQEEAGLDLMVGQHLHEGGHPLTKTLQGVHVDFDG